ncbi:MAG: flagellar filament capping protein FliD [Lachnospiraceae bacterium]|nr:flagellar filament capping protein FliD [Lachnospiraceae bacterium]MBQ8878372.1 flagellar filament capping protein FliD [Lachnospiraceae bacterium]
MAYHYALSSIYNHYQTAYAPKSAGRHDAHKKSELRGIYNSIVKLNKDTPLSIIDTSEESREYAVSLKENARQLRNTIADLGGLDEEALLSGKVAYSTNPNVITAEYIGDSFLDEETESFELSVTQLAKPQINTGNYLTKHDMQLAPGSYSFDLDINHLSYELQFNINEGDTNFDLQNRLTRLINNSNLGIKAGIKEYENDTAALSLESSAVGIDLGQNIIFSIKDSEDSQNASVVDYLGLDQISTLPQNAVFKINGMERVTNSNHFTIEQTYEVTLHNLHPEGEDSVTIGLKPDTESLSDNVGRFVSGYNDFIRAASEYLNTQPGSTALLREMHSITSLYHPELSSLGLEVTAEGTIDINQTQLRECIQDGNARELFSGMRRFTNSILNKTNDVSLNPMNYVQKTIVAYKNPGKEYPNPYITSQYSGMLFNGYC